MTPPTDPAPPSFDDVPQTGAGPSVADQVAGTVARKLLGWIAAAAGSGLVALIGASLLFWSTVQADAARAEEVHRTMQRDVAHLEGDVEEHGHAELGEDVATLRTKIDRMQEDVDRIERLLDERLPPRPRRR